MDTLDATSQPTAGEWRHGTLLVIDDGSVLPERCPKCSSTRTLTPLTLAIVRTQARSGRLANTAADAFDRLTGSHYTGPVRFTAQFCSRHRRLRGIFIALSIALIAIGAAGSSGWWLLEPHADCYSVNPGSAHDSVQVKVNRG
jgi:hypothetical protein